MVGEFVRRRTRGMRVERFGEAEVEHLHRAVRAHLDVRGLQVAVDDPLLVRGLERLRDLPGDGQCFVERHLGLPRRSARSAKAGDALRQIFALHELHHERVHLRPP